MQKPQDTYCLTFRVSSDDKDLLPGIFYSLDMLGCEESELGRDCILKCYFSTRYNAERADEELKARVLYAVESTIVTIPQQDWNSRWRETMEPVRVSRHCWVSPKWLRPPLQKDDHWIVIEPKMAFGTGHHETTQLAAEALSTIKSAERTRLLDIGTGSGILCFAADYYGYRKMVGVEIDTDCLENLAENRKDNPVQGTVGFIIGSLDAMQRSARFDTIVMNMIRTQSEPLLDLCYSMLERGGLLVWSGILCDEKDSVIECAHRKGWRCGVESTKNEWWCGVFKKEVIG